MDLLEGRDEARLLANVPGDLLVVDPIAEDHTLLVHNRQILFEDSVDIMTLKSTSGTVNMISEKDAYAVLDEGYLQGLQIVEK